MTFHTSTKFGLAAALLLLAAGCGEEALAPDRSSLTGQPSSEDKSGTAPAGATDPVKGTTAPGTGVPPCDPGPNAPQVWTEEKGPNGEVCKVCYDANKKELWRSCNGTVPPAGAAKCWVEETKDSVCKVCVDSSGKEIVRACDKPTTGTTEPQPPANCKVGTGKNGESCKVCYDASGKEVARGCAGTTPPDGGKCWVEETKESVCKVCVDATGKELARACGMPATGGANVPPGPTVKCMAIEGPPELDCKICYDATGVPVSKECVKR